jgi:MFS transporter, ACS family, solute carrier family 17 (sodium-dependent inorganic phosphate cotransporter), other
LNINRWFPTEERATAVGISMGGFHLGNVISFLSTPIIMSHIGLTGTFAFFASLGYLWISVWLFNVESDPLDSRTISKSELQYIVSGRSASKLQDTKFPSLKELLSKMEFWAIIVANVVNNWVRLTQHSGNMIWLYCVHILTPANSKYPAGLFCLTIMDACVFQDGML